MTKTFRHYSRSRRSIRGYVERILLCFSIAYIHIVAIQMRARQMESGSRIHLNMSLAPKDTLVLCIHASCTLDMLKLPSFPRSPKSPSDNHVWRTPDSKGSFVASYERSTNTTFCRNVILRLNLLKVLDKGGGR